MNIQYGKIYTVRPKSWAKNSPFRVSYWAEDSETPVVQIRITCPHFKGNELQLTDSDAQSLIDQLSRALGCLPSSK